MNIRWFSRRHTRRIKEYCAPASLRSPGAPEAREPESSIEKLEASLRPVVPSVNWLGIGQREKTGVAKAASAMNPANMIMSTVGEKGRG